VRLARPSRGEHNPLVVPVIPGAVSAPRDEAVPPAPGRSRLAFVVAGVVMLGLIFFVGFLLSHGPSKTQVTPVSTQARARVGQHAAAKPTALQLAHAAAVKLAAELPVALETAGLIRLGKNLYVVGGNARRGGQPTDAVLRIELPSGRVRAAGRFIEPLADAAAARRGGVLYLVGGWTGAKVATAVLRWAPGTAVTVVARLPVGVRGASAAFVGKRLYVAGGSPRTVFAVDVRSGKVVRAERLPRQLHQQVSNLDYLTDAQSRS
jgi:hypothetical protein